MANNIIALLFEGEATAENMLSLFKDMQDKGELVIDDAVIAWRGIGGDVKIKQSQSVTGKYALRGTGIGLLAGLLLGGPIGGLAAGAAIGAISGSMKDIGIDDKFVEQVSEALRPDSSALFVMGKATDPEKFLEDLRPFKAIVVSTTLSDEQLKKLKSALAEEE